MTDPTVGGSTDAWGGLLNGNIDILDAIFASNGTAVAMNFTGKNVTLAGSGKIDSAGKVGIGMTPANIIDITQTQNAATIGKILNGSNGSSAASEWRATNDSGDNLRVLSMGSGFTTSGVFIARRSVLASDAPGFVVTTTSAQPLIFGINSAEVGRFAADGSFQTKVYTVATLPAGAQGARAFVSDANATTFASIVAGGGANPIPVYHDGTNWRIG